MMFSEWQHDNCTLWIISDSIIAFQKFEVKFTKHYMLWFVIITRFQQFAPTGQNNIVYGNFVQLLKNTKQLISSLYKFCVILTKIVFYVLAYCEQWYYIPHYVVGHTLALLIINVRLNDHQLCVSVLDVTLYWLSLPWRTLLWVIVSE